jgi:hypothetical protein
LKESAVAILRNLAYEMENRHHTPFLTPGLVDALIDALKNGESANLKEHAAITLLNLAIEKEIIKNGEFVELKECAACALKRLKIGESVSNLAGEEENKRTLLRYPIQTLELAQVDWDVCKQKLQKIEKCVSAQVACIQEEEANELLNLNRRLPKLSKVLVKRVTKKWQIDFGEGKSLRGEEKMGKKWWIHLPCRNYHHLFLFQM